ncbi:MAG TPA: hypothetical protein VFC78_08930, partial [Tepidisphaeraceae bacterium]|nr:hypothetical protein [Tepidisphaeraceae bacterium]
EQAQTLATQETKWKESQRRHSTQAANVRMEPGKPDSGPIGLNAIALTGEPTWVVPADYSFGLLNQFARSGDAARVLAFVRLLLERFEDALGM